MSITKFIEGKLGFWQYRIILTQTDVGGGNADIRFTPGIGNFFIIHHFMIGPNNYASSRTVRHYVLDENNNIIKQFENGSLIDNTRNPFPNSGRGSTANSSQVDNLQFPYVVAGDEQLNLSVASLAQNETMTLVVRAFIKGAIPTIDVTNSTGTISQSVTSNSVHV